MQTWPVPGYLLVSHNPEDVLYILSGTLFQTMVSKECSLAFIFALVTREHLCCLRLQFQHSRSTPHTTSISSRLILITAVSEQLSKIIENNERVKRVRRFVSAKFLKNKVRKRKKLAMQLEALEIAQIRSFNCERPSTLPKSLAKFEIRYEIRKLDTEIRQIQKSCRDGEDEASRAMLVELKDPTDIRDLDSLGLSLRAIFNWMSLFCLLIPSHKNLPERLLSPILAWSQKVLSGQT